MKKLTKNEVKKKCSKCHRYKNINDFSRNKNRPDGHGYYCKSCVKIKMKKYRCKMISRSNNEIIIPVNKKCCICNEIISSEGFYKTKYRKDGLYSFCKKCSKKKNKKHFLKMISNRHLSFAIPINKKCSKCGKTKLSKEFRARKINKDGLGRICKKCTNEYSREYCRKMSNRMDEDIIIPSHKKCPKCGENKSSDEFYKYRSRKDGLNVHCKNCVYERDEKFKKENDLHYRLVINLRSSLRRVLKARNAKKSYRIMTLVGCSVGDLITHLESQMSKGMTWDNYGGRTGWQIDHVKPCSAFNLEDPAEQAKCFHYNNLSPLWAKDNLRKNSFYHGKFIRRKRRVKNV